MLGIGKGITKGNPVRSVVKKGLQAWYKADKTQAPLGEQEIANGDFNLGPDLVDNNAWSRSNTVSSGSNLDDGDDLIFPGNSNTAFTPSQSGITLGPEGFRFVTQGGSSYIGMSAGTILTEANSSNATVTATYTILQSNDDGALSIANSPSDIHLDTSVGTHTVYFEPGRNDLLIKRRGNSRDVTIANVSVRQTNPNDNWSINSGTTVRDGEVFLDATNSGTATQTNAIVSGKKYQYSLQAKSGSGTSGTVKLADGTGTHLTQASVPATYTTYTGSFTAENTSIAFSEAGSGGVYVKDVSIKEITNSVRDYSKNNNNAVLYSGKALDFDGTGDYVSLESGDELINPTSCTYAVWFKAQTQAGGDRRIFTTSYDSGATHTAALLDDDDYLKLYLRDSAGDLNSLVVSSQTFVDDKWRRLICVIKSDVQYFYLDNVLIGTTNHTMHTTIHSNPVRLASGPVAGSVALKCTLSDFQIYDKAWTASDVTYDWENPDGDVFDDEGRAEVLGAELVTNGDLTSGLDNWTTTNTDSTHTVTHTSKGARFIADTTGVITTLSSPSPIIVGGTYKLEVVISEFQGSAGIKVDNGSITPSPLVFDSVGTFVYTFIATAAISTPVSFYRNGGDVDITIQSVSVKEVITHASTILPTDCKALYRLNEGAGDRVYNAAPVLSAEMWDGANGDISNWQLFGDGGDPGVFNTAAEDSGAVKITYVTSSSGGYIMLRAAKDLKADLVVGGTYEISFSTKVNQGSIVWRCLTSGGGINATATAINSTSFETRTMIVVADHETDLYIHSNDMTTGDIVWIKDISVKEVSLSNSYALAGDPEWATAQPYIPQYAMSSYSKKAIFGGASSGDYVALGSEVVVAADEAASISFWFTYGTTDTSTDKYILGKASGATDYLIINPQSSGVDKIQIQMNNQTALAFNIETDLTLGKVYHCVVTIPAYSSGSEAMKCYINGVQQSDTENRTNDPWDFQWIGALTGSTNNFDGILDEFAHFSKELSATEVSELFNGGMALDARDHSAYLGSELVTNGDFSTSFTLANDSYSGGWDLGSTSDEGVSIENGQLKLHFPAGSDTDYARVYASSGSDNNIKPADHAGKIYELKYDVISKTGAVLLRGYNGGYVDLPSEIGTNTYTFTSSPTNRLLVFKHNDADQTIVLDNIQLKEVQLQGYWRNNGTDDWGDLSEYGNDGTVNGSPTTIQLQEVPYFKKDTLGLPMNKVRQKGLNFDGDSYVEIDDDNSLDITTGLTMEAWVKFNDFDYSYNIMQKKNIWNSVGYGIYMHTNGDLIFEAGEDDGGYIQRGSTSVIDNSIDKDTWVFLTITHDAATEEIKWYKNGDWKQTKSSGAHWNGGPIGTNTLPLSIGFGEGGSTSGGHFSGIIDEPKVYSRALTLSEIKKNWKASKSKHKDNTVSNWSDDFTNDFI